VSPAPRTLEFFFFDAGGGHRAAAIALSEVIAEQYPGWRISLVNLQELLDPVDMFRRVTGTPSQDFYNAILKRGWTFGSQAMLRTLQRAIRFYTPNFEAVVEKHWQTSRPDLVVSLIPNFNGILFRALRRVHRDIPYVTIMTDLADFPPHFWQEKQDQFIVCGTGRAVAQATAVGYPPDRIFRTSGMILKPLFYRPDLPTALIMFGGYGSKSAERIVDRLARSELAVQSIVICGHNEKLRAALQGRRGCHAVGFTDRVPDYMRMADFFIGKPGPGSISEALQMGLPVIIERNRMTMPQERPNTEWVEEHQLGIVIRDFRHIAEAVQTLLGDGRLEAFRRNAARLNNRAVYEIPAMLERIMETA
jgi:UDP-N-acetylglucosamine:LPS N-acetylglucosamine transferase